MGSATNKQENEMNYKMLLTGIEVQIAVRL